MHNQIKSRDRVASFGEVYTQQSQVSKMLDLVYDKSYNIETRFLEPACGNGNFLIEILKRKLKTVKKQYKNSQIEYEQYAFLAISNIYGIDILEDNVDESRKRLFEFFLKQYKLLYKNNCSDGYIKSIKYVLSKNIICGDGVEGTKKEDVTKTITFSQWTFPSKNIVVREDYTMARMIAYNELHSKKEEILKPYKRFNAINFKEVYTLG